MPQEQESNWARIRLKHFNNWLECWRFEKRLGHHFVTPEGKSWLRIALTTEGAGTTLNLPDYRMFEMLGDAALLHILSEHYPPEIRDRGATIDNLVKAGTLAEAAKALDIHKMLIHPAPLNQEPGQDRLTDGYEAVLGVIFLRKGYSAAREFVFRTLNPPQIEREQSLKRPATVEDMVRRFEQQLPEIEKAIGHHFSRKNVHLLLEALTHQSIRSVPFSGQKPLPVRKEVPPAIEKQLGVLKSKVPQIEQSIGYHFHNKDLLQLAFTHSSVQSIDNQAAWVTQGNATLKLAAVLHSVSEWLPRLEQVKIKDQQRNNMLKQLTILASVMQGSYLMQDYFKDKANLATCAEQMGVKDAMVIAPNQNKGPKALSDTVIALTQAIYVDALAHFKDETKAIQAATDFVHAKIIAPLMNAAELDYARSFYYYQNILTETKTRHADFDFRFDDKKRGEGYPVTVTILDGDKTLFTSPPSKPYRSLGLSKEAAAGEAVKWLTANDNPFRHTVEEALRKTGLTLGGAARER